MYRSDLLNRQIADKLVLTEEMRERGETNSKYRWNVSGMTSSSPSPTRR